MGAYRLNAREKKSARGLIALALGEDRADADVTVRGCGIGGRARATIMAKSDGIFAGGELIALTYRLFAGRKIRVVLIKKDGDRLRPGDVVARLAGDAAPLLTGERTALNFIGHLSGVASLTSRFVAMVRGTKAVILDTRKTTPGLRLLEKYAVRCGGGKNHRPDLASMALVKENHLRAFAAITSAGDLMQSLSELRKRLPKKIPIEVEVEHLRQLFLAAQAPVDYIMLDNFGVRDARRAIAAVRKIGGNPRLKIEVSGGVGIDNVRAYALAGADRISLGCLTHSAPVFDFTMLFEKNPDEHRKT